MMKTGLVITARLGSTRLKHKHLQEVNGSPLMSYLIGRIAHEFQTELQAHSAQIVIATSDEPENREFEQFAAEGVKVFYGSNANIPLRHLQAAQALSLDLIVAIDGDDILCSRESMRQVFTALLSGARYVKTSGLPLGLNAFGYSSEFLEQSLKNHHNDTLETGWTRIFDESVLRDIPLVPTDNGLPLRFTLDYPDDLDFFRAIINELGSNVLHATTEEIVSMVIEKRFYEKNEEIASEYWNNFHKNVNKEDSKNENE